MSLESVKVEGAYNHTHTENLKNLQEKFDDVCDSQGCIKNLWNSIKEKTGLGLSKSDVNNLISEFENSNSNLTVEEISNTIEKYDKKQEDVLNSFGNILSSTIPIFVAGALFASGVGLLPTILIGATIGGAIKAGAKIIDRVTNKKEGDAFETTGKDIFTGAIQGGANSFGVYKVNSIMASTANNIRKGKQCVAFSSANETIQSTLTNLADTKKPDEIMFGSVMGMASGLISGITCNLIPYSVIDSIGEIGEESIESGVYGICE